jgi:hypothetical protein
VALVFENRELNFSNEYEWVSTAYYKGSTTMEIRSEPSMLPKALVEKVTRKSPWPTIISDWELFYTLFSLSISEDSLITVEKSVNQQDDAPEKSATEERSDEVPKFAKIITNLINLKDDEVTILPPTAFSIHERQITLSTIGSSHTRPLFNDGTSLLIPTSILELPEFQKLSITKTSVTQALKAAGWLEEYQEHGLPTYGITTKRSILNSDGSRCEQTIVQRTRMWKILLARLDIDSSVAISQET